MLGVTAEMQNLHCNAPTFVMDGTRDEPVLLNIFGRIHHCACPKRPARTVRRNAPRHD